MVKIPQLKKKICAFLTKEDGKISKENLIKTGILLSAFAIASLKTAYSAHSNVPGVAYDDPTATGQHASHSSHGSHASHASY